MTRCDYDGVFYRVFCVTLLAIAFTFTVILTNVFIDIDGLLASKEKLEKEKPPSHEPTQAPTVNNEVLFPDDNKVEQKTDSFYDFKTEREDDEGNYRTKRSLDTQNFQFHVRNPKMKEILTHKLATLLEELDAEETQTINKIEKTKDHEGSKIFVEVANIKLDDDNKKEKVKPEDDLLHLAMHNILLQGIIGHMDLNDVYKKVHQLVQNFDLDGKKKSFEFRRKGEDDKQGTGKSTLNKKEDESKEIIEIPKSLFSIETKFFEELTKCDKLKKQIVEETNDKLERLDTRRSGNNLHDKGMLTKDPSEEYDVVHVETLGKDAPHMLIKTIIDIKTLKNDHNRSLAINENNIKGLIKLIYNGKPIKFTRMEDEEEKKKSTTHFELDGETQKIQTELLQDESGNILDTYLDQAINKYLKKYPKLENKFKNKRLKRNVKVRPSTPRKVVTTEKPKHSKNDEEELYVEIETHFDGKGIKGEKKKKLVKDLVDKIQKAIHADLDTLQAIAKKQKRHKKGMVKIRKRLQNPLEIKEDNNLKNKIIIPLNKVVHRESHPISKSVRQTEEMPKVYDKFGEIWKRTYQGSNFLSKSKSINSGELGMVDLDYTKVQGDTGIPQRLQQPLNTDNIEDEAEADTDSYFNLGDLKFYIKDLDGTGFSIGFNQYVGEAPDPESIKLFTGLQQLIKTYHQNYDETANENEPNNNTDTNKSADVSHEVQKRDVSRAKRPGAGVFDDSRDFHSNEYKIVFDNHFLPYDSYSEIFEDKNKKVTLSLQRQNKETNVEKLLDTRVDTGKRKELLPFIIDDNLFKKQLKPSEIFGLANLLDRKKRSPKVTVRKYSDLKTRSRSKINRFLNTNRMNKRLIMSKNKRSKRQIDKIRIIATDTVPNLQRHSDENIFVMSDENIFADRAVVREVEVPDTEDQEDHAPVEYLNPHRIYDHNTQAFKFGQSQPSYTDFFSARSRHNALMSKYPHLFLEEISRSKEEESPFFYTKLMGNVAEFKNSDTTSSPYLNNPVVLPSPQSTGEINLTPGSKPNYKLTVKIVPKNNSDIDSGFKEIYTSINKSINRNGLVYSSQVNVSEVSKIENVDQKNKQVKPQQQQQELRYFPMENKPESKPEEKQEPKPTYQPPPQTYNPCNNSYPANMANIALPPPINNANVLDKGESSTTYFPLVKHIREQQEKMKQLLRQHRKRIDDQLDTLKREKQNIESIIVPNEKEKKGDIIDVMLPLNPPQMLHLNKAEAGQLITSALMKLHDAPQINDISLNGLSANASSSIMESLTTKVTTATPMTTTTAVKSNADGEKQKILKTIQKNENLTNIILYKIDKNTNLLQMFLEKLSDKLLPVTPKQEPYQYIPPEPKMKQEFTHLKEWKESYEPFFSKTMPNLEVRKNDTHVSIPFVYAYQQPFPLPNKANAPVASVVYQGHIHTNANYNNNVKRQGDYTITRDDKTRKVGPDIKREANKDRFFFDNIQGDYKVSPIDVKKAYDMSRNRYNVTKSFKQTL